MQQTVVDNRYALVELLGSGGMAEVYLARDKVLARDVALKILNDRYAGDEEFVERFRREARSAAGLSHPNIVFVYDQGRSEDGAYYMAMEYVPNGTLKERIRREDALEPIAAAGVSLQIADALQAAHERGLIHRDIKPQNVLVTRTGDVKVTDFGIARAASATALTRTDHILGTVSYMSPEQAKGEPLDHRSDLYSLGVVLYEMLTSNLPYDADGVLAQAIKHINELPPSPREVNPEVPEALDALTMKVLAKDPEDRYPSAAALAHDLERIRSELHSGAEQEETEVVTAPLPPSSQGRTQRTTVRQPVAVPAGTTLGGGGGRRGRLLPVLAALLLVVVLLGGLAFDRGFFEGFDPTGSDVSDGRSSAEDVGTGEVPGLEYASEAADAPAAERLRPGNRGGVSADNVPMGEVGEQRPAAGNAVESDTAVDVIAGKDSTQTPAQIPNNAGDTAPDDAPNNTGGPPSTPQAAPKATIQQPDGTPSEKPRKAKRDEKNEAAEEDCEGPVCLID